jgi:hypothetical protein
MSYIDSYYLNLVKNNGLLLQYSDEKTKNICEAAINNNGLALQYVPKNSIDRDMCIKAINKNGLALQFVIPILIDQDMCINALSKNALSLQFVPEKLMNETVITFALFKNGLALKFVPDNLKNDFYSQEAMKNNPNALEFVKELHQTEEMIQNAVQKDGLLLRFAYMKSKEACIKAIKNNREAGNYIPDYLMNDNDLIKLLMMEELLKQNGMLLKDFDNPPIEMCKVAVEQNAYAIQYVPKEINTLELCILAVSKFCCSLQFINEDFKESCEKHILNNTCNTHEKTKIKCFISK